MTIRHTLALTFMLTLCGGVDAATVEERVARTFEVGQTGLLDVENVNGGISVTAWDRPEVHVLAEIQAKAETEVDARKALGELTIEMKQRGDRIGVGIDRDGWDLWNFLRDHELQVKFTARVPSGFRLKLESVNGKVVAKGIGGRVEVEAVNGSVVLEDLRGSFEASTVNGKITASVVELPDGDEPIEAETVNGAIRLTLPADIGADIDIETTNGGIRSDFPLKQSDGSAKGTVNGGGRRISLETVNGGIRILKSGS